MPLPEVPARIESSLSEKSLLAPARPPRAMWVALATIIFLDQLTKTLVAASMDLYQSIPILGDLLRLTYIRNPGGAFGLRWGHVAVYYVSAGLVISWIAWHLWHDGHRNRLSMWALVLILAGAIGNLIDRVLHGEVIDFIDAEFFNLRVPAFDIGVFQHPGLDMERWPTFNIADSAVTVGVILLLLSLFWDPALTRESATSPPEAMSLSTLSPADEETAPSPHEQHDSHTS